MADGEKQINLPQPLPKAVRPDQGKVNGGGYDCEFVEAPPKVLQTECSVCLLILKEPCIVTCCGHKFCQVCIERVEKTKKPCPLCNNPDFTFIRELALQRSLLNEFDVYCSYRKDGCDWKGRLGELVGHLNRDSFPENQPNECQFVEVECGNKCGEWFHRCDVATHESKQCKKRPYSCDHCTDYDSTFEDVTKIHYPQCSKYPVACPNECRVYKFERQELKSHLQDHCPLALVTCPFHYAGCETQLPRKDMPEHMKENYTHITLLATTTQRLFVQNQALVKENHELQQKVIQLEETSHKSVEEVQVSLQALHKKCDALGAENDKWCCELRNKEKSSKESTAKVDTSLKTLRQQYENLATKHKQYHNELRDKERASKAEVHASLQAVHTKCDAVVAELNAQLQILHNSVAAEHPPVFPIEFKVNKKENKAQSPTFHTHPRGYRMCVEVYPTGIADGKGTHVSIFTYLMKDPCDEYLKWPFRGEVTIQIVNQAGDHDHVERTTPFTDKTPDGNAGRVTDKERSGGWGNPQFLPLTALHYTKKTQYLKDNHLIVRVVKVKVT